MQACDNEKKKKKQVRLFIRCKDKVDQKTISNIDTCSFKMKMYQNIFMYIIKLLGAAIKFILLDLTSVPFIK
jgi:hypothetical protein